MKNNTTKSVLVSVCLFLLCAAGTMAATTTVYIISYEFIDASGHQINPTINLGDSVTWVWSNGFHSTTAAPGQLETWDSGAQGTVGFMFSHTFNNLGTYNYYCKVHSMTNGCRQVAPSFSFSMMTGYVAVVSAEFAGPWQIDQVAQQGSDLLVGWVTGGICFTNILQRSTGNPDGSYNTNFTDIFTVAGTTGNTTNFLDAGAATNFPFAYYRVRVPQ